MRTLNLSQIVLKIILPCQSQICISHYIRPLLVPNGNIFEVQIRTKEMDEVAEQGVAAHWAYKENRQITAKQEQQEIQDKLKWYETLIAYQEEVNDAEKLMKPVKR